LQKYRCNAAKFRKHYLPWVWLGILPSLILDAFLILRLIAGISVIRGSSVPTTPLQLLDFVMLLVINAVFFKSLPIIVYLIHRAHLMRSVVLVTEEIIIYTRRVLVMYEFDYGFTHTLEYQIKNVRSVIVKRNGSLLIKGDFEVRCLDESGEPVLDLRKVDLMPRIVKRKKCLIPGVFEGMEQITDLVMKRAAV